MKNQPIILVYYIRDSLKDDNILDIATQIEQDFNIMKKRRAIPDDTVMFIIPHNSDNRLECINPILMSDSEYTDVRKTLKTINQKFKDFLTNRTKFKINEYLNNYEKIN